MLIGLNAFFVASEMAYARIRRTRIDQLVEEGSHIAAIAQKSLNNPDKFISACQLGITLATLALGAVGEITFADNLSEFIGSLPFMKGSAVAVASVVKAGSYVVAFSFTALLQTVFGEILPKTLTFHRAEQVLFLFIWPMEFWQWLTSPIIKLLNVITTFSLNVLNIKDPPRYHFAHSEEELKMLVQASREEGVLEEEEQEMLHSVFDFADTVASEVMTPRTDMVCVQAGTSVKDFIELALNEGRTRIPTYDVDIDNIFGFIHVRDALRALTEGKAHVPVKTLVRKTLIVPENKNLGVLLKEFKKTKTHMAIVVDEYGGTRGMVTIQDLVEELVGDIADEHEEEEETIVRQPDGSYLLDAKLSLYEANEKLGLDIEDSEFNTLAGHVFGLLGRQPEVGDEVCEKDYALRIEALDRTRIVKLRLTKRAASAEHGGPNGTAANGSASGGGDQSNNKPVESNK